MSQARQASTTRCTSHFVFDFELQVVVRFADWSLLGDRRKGSFGRVHIAASGNFAQMFAGTSAVRQRVRRHGVQHFVRTTAKFLDPVGVAIENFQHRQRFALGRQLARHMIRRRQRHERVEADVVFAAKGPRIGQRAGRHQGFQIVTRLQLRHERAVSSAGGVSCISATKGSSEPKSSRSVGSSARNWPKCKSRPANCPARPTTSRDRHRPRTLGGPANFGKDFGPWLNSFGSWLPGKHADLTI